MNDMFHSLIRASTLYSCHMKAWSFKYSLNGFFFKLKHTLRITVDFHQEMKVAVEVDEGRSRQ